MPAAVTKTAALYERLNLQPDATDDEVRIAYKKLALKWHPDRCQDNKEEAQEKFVEIQDAYLKILEERERHRKHKPRKKTDKSDNATRTAPSSTPSAASTSSSTSGRANTECSDRTSSPRQESVPLKEEKERKPREHKQAHKPATQTNHHHSTTRSDPSSSRPSSEYSSASTSTPRRESVPLKEDKHHKRSTPDQSSDPAQSVSKKLKKRRPDPPTHTHSSKPSNDSSGDEELYPKKSHFTRKSNTPLEDTDYEFVDLADLSSPLHPLRTPKSKLRGLGDDSKDKDQDSNDSDWVFPLPVTLEDMYEGVSQHYRITRTLRSGKTQDVKIDVKVSPNWYDGTEIRVAGVGNERKDGVFQDIVFKVEVHPHPAFTRKGDDLLVSVQVPWADPHTRPYPPSDDRGGHSSTEEEDEVYLKALNGKEYAVPIPRSLVEGADGTRIKGAGMPIRKHGKNVGKGDMIIKWEFIFSDFDKSRNRTSWQTFKRAMHLKR